jgi:hypothetical protein
MVSAGLYAMTIIDQDTIAPELIKKNDGLSFSPLWQIQTDAAIFIDRSNREPPFFPEIPDLTRTRVSLLDAFVKDQRRDSDMERLEKRADYR